METVPGTPRSNFEEIAIRFDRDAPAMDIGSVRLFHSHGTAVRNAAFRFDTASFTGVWTFDAPLTLDSYRIEIDLDGDGDGEADEQYAYIILGMV